MKVALAADFVAVMKQHKFIRFYLTLYTFQKLGLNLFREVQERSHIRRLQLASIFVAIRAKLAYDKRIAKLGPSCQFRMVNEIRQAVTFGTGAIIETDEEQAKAILTSFVKKALPIMLF